MSAYFNPKITVFMTSKDLRRIADLMDERWQDSIPGGDLEVYRWFGKGCEVVFVIDQERMEKQSGPSGERAMQRWREKREE